MRLVFLYVTHKATPGVRWEPDKIASDFYSNRVMEEGYYFLLKRLVEEKIVDEVVIFVESGSGQGIVKYDVNNLHGWVMPDVKNLPNFLRDDDIIFIRGGFKGWYETLEQIRERGNWMLLYAANTGRERWPIWDVIFDDLNGYNHFDGRGTFRFDFKKPTNNDIFYPMNVEVEYDLCIGASYISDKKGQYKTVEALVEYKRLFGKNLKCIMPGIIRNGVHTNDMVRRLRSGLDVYQPGMVDRRKLNKIYNKSKYLIHLGGGGQGDRSLLEAMSCGTPVIYGNTTRHSKVVYGDPGFNVHILEDCSMGLVARVLEYQVSSYKREVKGQVLNYYEEMAGMDTVILPEMRRLFEVFRKYPKRDMEVLRRLYE